MIVMIFVTHTHVCMPARMYCIFVIVIFGIFMFFKAVFFMFALLFAVASFLLALIVKEFISCHAFIRSFGHLSFNIRVQLINYYKIIFCCAAHLTTSEFDLESIIMCVAQSYLTKYYEITFF